MPAATGVVQEAGMPARPLISTRQSRQAAVELAELGAVHVEHDRDTGAPGDPGEQGLAGEAAVGGRVQVDHVRPAQQDVPHAATARCSRVSRKSSSGQRSIVSPRLMRVGAR